MAQALCEILRLEKYEVDHFDSGAFEHGQRLNPEIKGNVTVVGALSVSSPAGHGIVCKDDLVLTGGSFTLVCGSGSENGDGFTGGTFIGTGASGMAQSFSDSEQGVIALRVGSQSAGTKIVLKDSDGNTIITYSPELDFEIVIISSPDIVKGETYTLCVGSFQTSIDASRYIKKTGKPLACLFFMFCPLSFCRACGLQRWRAFP